MTDYSHREVLAEPVTVLADELRPEPGAIAILPAEDAGGIGSAEHSAAQAVRDAGGTVAPLSDATRGVIYTAAREVDALVSTLERYPAIGWVQLPFAGIDAFGKAIIPAAERGVLFTSAKGAYAQPVAEHALMLTLALARELPLRLRARSWGASSGQSIFGARVLVVGAGGIAREYLRLLQPFGVTTTVVRRRPEPVPGADRTLTTADIDSALSKADIVMLAAASTHETRSLIDARRLASMKPTAVLVNIARGALVDTEALREALDSRSIYGAGLDVTDPEPLPKGHPLYSHERCIITPHTADTPEMVWPLLDQRIRDNVRAFLDTGSFIGIADPRLGY